MSDVQTDDAPNPYSAAARTAAAIASLEPGQDPGSAATTPQAEPEPTPALGASETVEAGKPAPEAQQQQQAEADPFDPAELRRIANERAEQRQQAEPTKEAPPPTTPAVDMEKLVAAMSRPGLEREAVEHLKRTGDVGKLAELVGTDPGTLTERIIAQGVEPGSVQMQSELQAANERIAKLEAMISGEDRALLTKDELGERLEAQAAQQRQSAYQEQLAASYKRVSVDTERFPLQAALANLAPEKQMEYALRADALLWEARKAQGQDRYSITAEEIAEVTERELRSIAQIAQTLGGASTHAAGEKSAAGTSAAHASTRGVGTLSNASASETVGAPADPYDMHARRQRAMNALSE